MDSDSVLVVFGSREKLENFPRTLLVGCGIYVKLVFYPMQGREVGITCWIFLPVHELVVAVCVCPSMAAQGVFACSAVVVGVGMPRAAPQAWYKEGIKGHCQKGSTWGITPTTSLVQRRD